MSRRALGKSPFLVRSPACQPAPFLTPNQMLLLLGLPVVPELLGPRG